MKKEIMNEKIEKKYGENFGKVGNKMRKYTRKKRKNNRGNKKKNEEYVGNIRKKNLYLYI